tara:strand:+ start:494 stop:736 length:243 start_codon:yes stop_codon:yes gene_type:complete
MSKDRKRNWLYGLLVWFSIVGLLNLYYSYAIVSVLDDRIHNLEQEAVTKETLFIEVMKDFKTDLYIEYGKIRDGTDPSIE